MNNRKTILLLFAALLLLGACREPKKGSEVQALFNPLEITALELKAGIAEGKWSIREITELYLAQIEKLNHQGPHLNAIISVNPEALSIADSLDKLWNEGTILGELHGIPIILKDNIESLDAMPTTGGSRALAENFVQRDAEISRLLRKSGAIIIAKANLSEWANFRGENSISGWSGMGGFTRNPYVLSRNPCGSSAGSAVAVASGMAPLAIGTETNGSIVCPSQTNGIFGLKPTVGLVPGRGIIPIAHSQDVAGPMAKSIADLNLVMKVIGQPDPTNPANLKNWPPPAYGSANLSGQEMGSKRIGVFHNSRGRYPKVDEVFDQAQADLKKLGYELIPVESILPNGTNYASFQVMLYEYQSDLNAYFQSLGPDAPLNSIEALIAFNEQDSLELAFFGQEYLEMALERTEEDKKSYLENLSLMHRNSRELGLDRIMDSLKLDVIIAPSGGPAWTTDLINGDHYLLGSSSPAAISGYPNVTVPMGSVQGLPIGLSFFGRAYSEGKLLETAYQFEIQENRRAIPMFLTTDPELKN